MERIRHTVIVILFLLTATHLTGQVGLEKVGQSTMNFQLVSVSPAASAMGEAFSAVGRGAESIFYNPAGIAETAGKFDLKMYSTQWIADMNYMAGAVAWNMGNFGTAAVSFLTVDYGDIYGTSLLAPGEQALYPQGYKDDGILSNVGAYSVGVSYGRAISTLFYVGGNLRLASQSLGRSLLDPGMQDNNMLKLVFDMGVKYYTGYKSFRFGMSIRNFSTNVKREEISEQMPIMFSMGMALDLFDFIMPEHSELNTLTLAVDFLHPNNYSERMNIGLEYMVLGRIALRGGYQTNQDLASWSAGIGLNTKLGSNVVQFDYSYSSFDIFKGVTRFSVGVGF